MAANNIQLPFQTSHAFVIGIDNYQHVSPLNTAVNDAQKLAEVLAKDHGYRVHPPLLDATHEDINHLLTQELARLVKAEDRVLFYFAGHGIALDSDDDPKGYLVPADALPGDSQTLVAMEDLHRTLTQLPCQHGLLILDCCFAGAFKWSTGFRDVVFDLPGIIYEERFYQYAQDPAWQVITSSASDQKAVDILSNRSLGLRAATKEKHSPFALALLEGLAGDADTIPKGEGDGVITATELYTYLRDRVEDETMEQGKRQSPSMFSLQKHDKGQYIFLHPRHRLNLPPIPKRNPFMGLQSYNEDNSSLFYGRGRVVAALHELAQEQSLIVVSGASGTGKSSVIKAGLLPQLREQGWDILPVVRPGKEPLLNLQSALPDELRTVGKRKAKTATQLHLPDKARPSLLIIDQYEELITQCLHEEDRYLFEQQLADWITQHPQLHIIISVRSDFEPQFDDSPLAHWWEKGRYIIPAFSQDELREVIIKPTIQEVLFFEPDSLVDQLVDAVNQAPGALPLLSFTLSELYHLYLKSGRTNRAFTQADYNSLGGVIGALSNRANTIYQHLDAAHQRSMQKLMLHMISLTGGEPASSRVLQSDWIYSSQAETERIQYLADQMVNARLLSSGSDQAGNTYYEPAPDALVRAWDQLWEWIKQVGEMKIRLMNKLSLAVEDYRLHQHEKGGRHYLWHNDPRLDFLRGDLLHEDHLFNAAEEAFIKASYRLRQRKQQRRWLIVASVIVGLVGLSTYALIERRLAEDQAQEAQYQAEQAQKERQKAEEASAMARLRQEQAEQAQSQAEASEQKARKARLEADSAKQAAEQALVGLQLEVMKEIVERSQKDRVPRTTALVGLQTFLYNFEHPAQGNRYDPLVFNSLFKSALRLWEKDRFYILADYSPIQMISTHQNIPTIYTASEQGVKAWQVQEWSNWGVPAWRHSQRSTEIYQSRKAKISDAAYHPQSSRLLMSTDQHELITFNTETNEQKVIPTDAALEVDETYWLGNGQSILAVGAEQAQLYSPGGELLSSFAKPPSSLDLFLPASSFTASPARLLSIGEYPNNRFYFSLQSLASPNEAPDTKMVTLLFGQLTAGGYYDFSPNFELLVLGTNRGNIVLSKQLTSPEKAVSLEDFFYSFRRFELTYPAEITAFAIAPEQLLLFATTLDGQLIIVDLTQYEKEGYLPVQLKLDDTAVKSLHYVASEQLLLMGKEDGSLLFFHYDPLRLAQCICEYLQSKAVNEKDQQFDRLNEVTWQTYFQNFEQTSPCQRLWAGLK